MNAILTVYEMVVAPSGRCN